MDVDYCRWRALDDGDILYWRVCADQRPASRHHLPLPRVRYQPVRTVAVQLGVHWNPHQEEGYCFQKVDTRILQVQFELEVSSNLQKAIYENYD